MGRGRPRPLLEPSTSLLGTFLQAEEPESPLSRAVAEAARRAGGAAPSPRRRGAGGRRGGEAQEGGEDPRPATDGLQLLAQTARELGALARGWDTPSDASTARLRQVRGLAHLHAHGLSHGDVKPSNVLLSA